MKTRFVLANTCAAVVVVIFVIMLTGCPPCPCSDDVLFLQRQVMPPEMGTVSVVPDWEAYNPGMTLTLEANAREGWRFSHWEGAVSNDDSASTDLVITSDQTVRAIFIPINGTDDPIVEAALLEVYQEAIDDAQIAEASEIVDTLTPIVPDNESLLWRGDGDEREVLMVTWTDWPGYDDLVGQKVSVDMLLKYETPWDFWVTAVPELRDFCRREDPPTELLSLRLEQLLGLPPNTGKDRFVEVWVRPDDLFRPCPDSEITDQTALLDFPDDTPQDYRDWFLDLLATSYGSDGYPWTRLGYTYDWGNPASEVGLSEFIIRGGATITIASVTGTVDYCTFDGSSSDPEPRLGKSSLAGFLRPCPALAE